MSTKFHRFDEGQRVQFVQSDPVMNADLIKQEGKTGVIQSKSISNGKCLIEFDGPNPTRDPDNIWWIKASRLDPADEKRTEPFSADTVERSQAGLGDY